MYLLFTDRRYAVYKSGASHGTLPDPHTADRRFVRTGKRTYGFRDGASGLHRNSGYHDDYQRTWLYCDRNRQRYLPAGRGSRRLVQKYFQVKGRRASPKRESHRIHLTACNGCSDGNPLNKTRPGRYILALGSNKEATRLSGVNVVKWETLAFIISGFFAALAGISYAAIYSTLMPGTGNGFELDAIAGVVIGGTSLSGGVGSIAGTLIGVFIMSVLKTGLPFVGLQPHWQLFITGFVLIIAVFADVVNRKNRAKNSAKYSAVNTIYRYNTPGS